ncbi:MAG: response regulator transcription factor [Kiritimatiellales bacterium]|nr:response regulator transcription factor [Pontiella sp.]NNJ69721.1 response regulator transcription factor [Kiritimatiellales bacterium]
MASEKKKAKKAPVKKKQVYLVDDHPIVRQGLIKLIEQEQELEVCGEAGSVPEALGGIREKSPDVILVDISLEDSNGLELIKTIDDLGLQIPTLVLSMHDESLYAEHALRAGASGYVMKQAASNTLIQAIEKVLDGEIYVSKTMSSQMLKMAFRNSGEEQRSGAETLSLRELEVFDLIGRGNSTREIAEQLHLSVKTIETYRAHIKEKLHLRNGTELMQRAIHWVGNESSRIA